MSLENLDLSYNKISKIPSTINDLVRLRELNIEFNQLKDIDNLNLTSLVDLRLSNNKIRSLPNINQLINLQRLYIASNGLNISNQTFYLNNLISICLGENEIKNINSLFLMGIHAGQRPLMA